MSALPDQPPLLRGAVSRELELAEPLAACVRALDPGARALLDLSLRRRMPLRLMAVVLRTDAFDLARRRARAVARITAELDLEGPGVVAMVKAALTALPDEVWGVPGVSGGSSPAPAAGEGEGAPVVQADVMKVQAAALMAKLRQRQVEEAARRAREVADAAVDDDVVDPLSLSAVFEEPVRQTPEVDLEPAPIVSEMLGPLTEALRRAAESERSASLRGEPATVAVDEVVEGHAETIEFEAVKRDEPTPPVAHATPVAEPPRALTYVAKPTRSRKIARGGILVALIAALLRFLFRR